MSSITESANNVVISAWNKFKSSINLTDGWIPFINAQLKWVAALVIRIGGIVLILLLIKFLGVAKSIRGLIIYDALGIRDRGSDVISTPNINYTSDIKNIDDVIKILESKKGQGDEKNEKKDK